MSTERRRRLRGEGGFTLVEVIIAMGLLAIVLTAALPVFISVLGSTKTSKLNTQGKNLAQERLEQIRDLSFHVDRQNGPFLDVLDVYYTNATAAGPVTNVPLGGATLTGRYVTAGTGSNNEPTGPYYRVQTGPLTGATGFSQVITAQFLGPDGSAVPKARFESTYNSQVTGLDAPPSLLLGIRVITSWTDAGEIKSYVTQTRVTDGRPQQPLIQSQARAVAVRVSSTAADATTLELQTGVVNVDGTQSTGSSVSGYATGALATRSGFDSVTGLTTQFDLPGLAASTSGSSVPRSEPGCSWYGFGRTSTSNVTGSIADGLPKAPSDVDSATPPKVLSASVDRSGPETCGQLSYDNTAGGGAPLLSTDPIGQHMGSAPWVSMTDATASGAAISGSGYATSSSNLLTPTTTKAGARASNTVPLVIFPASPDSAPSGLGLVSVTLTSSQLDCASSEVTVGPVSARYTLTLGWWGRSANDVVSNVGPSWRTATWTYNSATSAVPVRTGAVWDPAAYFLSDGRPLADLVSGPVTPAVLSTGATNGLRGFPNGILSLTTAPTLSNETQPGFSAINVQVGLLTCVADDSR